MILHLKQGMKIRDEYTLEQLLGVGASGEVWKASDGYKPVAIKFMNETLLQSEKADKHRARLEREIHALGLLAHPNIPRLYDFDLDFERPFIVMEYISSPTFEFLLSNGDMLRVPVLQRLEIIAQMADALTAAHEAGIIHRDIKPGNMNGTDMPYLLDFSIALEEENLEHTNFNVGTTIYMTPGGETPDRLADNYSFALVAYEVLFGQHPLFPPNDDTRNMGAYSRIVAFNRLKAGDWSIPSRLDPSQLPADLRGADMRALDAIFKRALGDRNQRYVQLSEFIDQLRFAVNTPATQRLVATVSSQTAQEVKPIATQPVGTIPTPSATPIAPKPPQPMPPSQSFTMLEVENAPYTPPTAPPLPPEYKTGEMMQVNPSAVQPIEQPKADDTLFGKFRKTLNNMLGKK
jgi:serine/threonine protein kinase